MTYRNDRLLRAVRALPCQHCGRSDGTVVAAHSNQLLDGKGRGLKASDYRIAALCFACHAEVDQGAKLDRSQRLEIWEDAHRRTMGELFERGLVDVTKGAH